MDDVRRLLAMEEIKQLKARYFRCMDTKDWQGLAKVFAADAIFDLREVSSVRHPLTGVWDPPFAGEERVYRGHTAVLQMIRDAVSQLITVHHGHMSEIEITSETTARGVWAMEDIIRSPPGAPRVWMQGFGHYHETYARLDDGWKIETTRITRLYMAPDPAAG